MTVTIGTDYTQRGYKMRNFLGGIGRCPHCSIANPHLIQVWASEGSMPRLDDSQPRLWGAFYCRTCGSVVTARGAPGQTEGTVDIDELFPAPKSAHEDIPDSARTYLQQAYDTLHAPDAAAVMAGSAVDAMLKEKGYDDRKVSLYGRIDQALNDNVLTKGMAEWAHSVRLGSNRPRHADKEKPNVSPDEAKQSVDFAEALGNFLFVLTARIDRGIKAAEAADTTS